MSPTRYRRTAGASPSGASGIPRSIYKTGWYYTAAANTQTHIPVEAEMRCSPFFVAEDITLDRIGLEVTSAGTAGALIRLGIYEDNGDGIPGALVIDAGTVDATTTGVKEIVISQALARGDFHLAAAVQGAAATRPTIRAHSGSDAMFPAGHPTATQISAYPIAGSYQTGVTGALPATAAITNPTTVPPRVLVRVA